MTENRSEFVTDLDSIEFDDLFLLGRAEIPRQAPDWTDHNVHDPGMTLIDVLAWIVDQQVFRIGNVGARHRMAFAALLGQNPHGARPARGIVWPGQSLDEGRLLRQGVSVVCVPRPALSFVLERPIYLTAASISGAETTVDGKQVPAPESDLNGLSWTIDGARHRKVTALTVHFTGQLVPQAGAAPLSLGFDVVEPPEPAPGPDDPAWGPVRYEYRDGGESEWTPLAVERDTTAGLATSGLVVLTVPEGTRNAGRSQLRMSFDTGFFPMPPRIRALTINALPVVQVEEFAAAPFDTPGTGQPDQTVDLVTSDLVPPLSRTDGKVLDITVGGTVWHEVDDLERSAPDAPHYVLAGDRVVFGNGLNGRCPPVGALIEHSVLARTSGAEGNLRRGLKWRVPSLDNIAGDFGANRHAFEGGRQKTTATELVAMARAAATQRQAMVTNDDVSKAAMELPGMAVGRAEVLSRFDPRMPERRVDGVRTLIVVPRGYSPDDDTVPQAYIDRVAERLGRRRLLGERIVVQGPRIVRASVEINVVTEPWADSSLVTGAVEVAVRNRLTPVQVDDVEPWPLGRDLTIAEIHSITALVEGVATVRSVRFSAGGQQMGQDPVVVPRDGVVVVGAQDLRVEAVNGASQGRTAPRSRGWN